MHPASEKVLHNLLEQPFGPYLEETILSDKCKFVPTKRLLLEDFQLAYNNEPTGYVLLSPDHQNKQVFTQNVALIVPSLMAILSRRTSHIWRLYKVALVSCFVVFFRSMPLPISQRRAYNILIMTIMSEPPILFLMGYSMPENVLLWTWNLSLHRTQSKRTSWGLKNTTFVYSSRAICTQQQAS